MELALSKSPDDNINFVDAIREIKVTVVEIPEQEFQDLETYSALCLIKNEKLIIVHLLLNYLLNSGEFSYFQSKLDKLILALIPVILILTVIRIFTRKNKLADNKILELEKRINDLENKQFLKSTLY